MTAIPTLTERARRKIVTHYVYPPIPIRTMDWAAWFDGEEGFTGYGPTEEAAIRDLLENADE